MADVTDWARVPPVAGGGGMHIECRQCGLRLDVPDASVQKLVSCPNPRCGSTEIGPIQSAVKATLSIVEGKAKGFSMTLGESCSVGRDPKNTCQILDDRISRHHASIQRRESRFFLRDLGSLNGSFLNDCEQKLTLEIELSDCDRVRMGDHVLEFTITQSDPSSPPRSPRPSLPGRPRECLTVIEEASESALIQAEVDAREEQSSIEQIDIEEDLETVKRAYKKLRLAFALHEQLTKVTDLDTVLKKILDLLFNIFPADRGVLLLADENGGFEPRVSKVREKEYLASQIRVSKTLMTYVQQRGKAILIQDAQKTVGTQSILLEDVSSAMSVPLFLKEKLVGILHVDCSGGHGKAFSAKDLDILTGIGNQIAIAIANVSLSQEIERKTELARNLGRYLSHELVEQIASQKIQIQMGGDTKTVTVMFSDIRGFTSLSETMEPKDVVALLNDYFEIMVECIFKFGGTLDKFIGDAIMAVWGSPIPDPLGAFNAVHAALEMQIELAHFNLARERAGKPPIGMGIGINTGPALAGNLGSQKRMEYTVIGDTVNLASRIEHMTRAGQVIISEHTASEVSEYLRADPLPITKVRGKSKEVCPYLVRGIYSPVTPESNRRKNPRMRVCLRARITNRTREFDQPGIIDDLTQDSFSVQVSLTPGNDFEVDDVISIEFSPFDEGSAPVVAEGLIGGIRYMLKTRAQVHHRVIVSITKLSPEHGEIVRRFLKLPAIPAPRVS